MKKAFQEELGGQFTTVRSELVDMVADAAHEIGCRFYHIIDCGDYIEIGYTDDEDDDAYICIEIENAGSTWYFTEVR